MANFYTSDHHFFHKNIIKLCNRPFNSLEEMHEKMIANWNDTVMPDDTVYYLGDFSFGSAEMSKRILNRLNGKKILIRGNHDKTSVTKLFGQIHKGVCLHVIDKVFISLSHYPYKDTEQDRESYPEAPVKPSFSLAMWLLHGHVHNEWQVRPKDKMINVGVDVWDFKPVSEELIKKIIATMNRWESNPKIIPWKVSWSHEGNIIELIAINLNAIAGLPPKLQELEKEIGESQSKERKEC